MGTVLTLGTMTWGKLIKARSSRREEVEIGVVSGMQ